MDDGKADLLRAGKSTRVVLITVLSVTYAECKNAKLFFVSKKATLDDLYYPSRTMDFMGPSPLLNVCECRSFLQLATTVA